MTAAAQPVGKAALAQSLSWSRPKLDRRLSEDPHFPVLSRGNQAGGWQFDEAAVRRYLNGGAAKAGPAKEKSKPSPPPAIDRAQLRDAVAPPAPPTPAVPVRPAAPGRRSAHHHGEATARQRKDNAEASLRENKLRIENGELVDRGELRQELATIFAALGSDLDGLPEAIAKLLDLPDEVPRIRDLIDKVRTQMVSNASGLLADD